MSEFEYYDKFTNMNALGNPMKKDPMDLGEGPVGNTRATGNMAGGINIDQAKSFHEMGLRKGMSSMKNTSAMKSMHGRK
jgi:hypothetical protein